MVSLRLSAPASGSRRSASRRVVGVVLGLGLLVPMAACGSDDGGSSPSGSASVSMPAEDSSATDEATLFTYEGRDGATALDLLLEADSSAQVSGSGDQAFVTAIGGREADSTKEFWALYVNGQMATVGAGALQTSNGDMIEWQLTEFEAN